MKFINKVWLFLIVKGFGSLFSVITILGILGILGINPIYAQEFDQYGNEIMDQLTEGVETGIKSIEVPNENIIDTNQEEVDNLAHSFSEWIGSFYDFGKKTHSVTEDAMAVVAPSWIDGIIISIIAGAVVVLIMWKVFKRVGIHLAIAFGILAAVIVFLMLLDLNS